MMILFQEYEASIGSSEEPVKLRALYERMPSRNLSIDVLECIPHDWLLWNSAQLYGLTGATRSESLKRCDGWVHPHPWRQDKLQDETEENSTSPKATEICVTARLRGFSSPMGTLLESRQRQRNCRESGSTCLWRKPDQTHRW